jgi:hypothetical protein
LGVIGELSKSPTKAMPIIRVGTRDLGSNTIRSELSHSGVCTAEQAKNRFVEPTPMRKSRRPA